MLAILALLTVRIRPLFWFFVVAFNVVGATDLLVNYYHAIRLALPEAAGQLGATYVIPILYVPMLMITHAVAFYWLARPGSRAVQAGCRRWSRVGDLIMIFTSSWRRIRFGPEARSTVAGNTAPR